MIYGLRNPKFRKAIKAVLTCKKVLINPYISQSNCSIGIDGHK